MRQIPLEEAVLSWLQNQLLTPELTPLFVGEFKRETARLKKQAVTTVDTSAAQLKEVTQQIDNIIDAIAAGIASATLTARLSELEARRDQLAARSKVVTAPKVSAEILPTRRSFASSRRRWRTCKPR